MMDSKSCIWALMTSLSCFPLCSLSAHWSSWYSSNILAQLFPTPEHSSYKNPLGWFPLLLSSLGSDLTSSTRITGHPRTSPLPSAFMILDLLDFAFLLYNSPPQPIIELLWIPCPPCVGIENLLRQEKNFFNSMVNPKHLEWCLRMHDWVCTLAAVILNVWLLKTREYVLQLQTTWRCHSTTISGNAVSQGVLLVSKTHAGHTDRT